MAPVKLDGQGMVETHTTLEVTAEGFDPPIYLGVVRVAEGTRGKTPVRVLVRSPSALTVGKAVKLEARGGVLWVAL